MLRALVILFGIVFIFIGVAGFLPEFTTGDMLFDLFQVNSVHNIVHIVVGVLAIMSATSYNLTRLFFQLLGIVFAIVAIVGFWRGDLMIMSVNFADNILHTVIAVIGLYLGFFIRKQQA